MSVEEAIDEMMVEIDEHTMAGSSVEQSDSVEFYEGIAEQCRDRAQIIRKEMGVGENTMSPNGDDDDE